MLDVDDERPGRAGRWVVDLGVLDHLQDAPEGLVLLAKSRHFKGALVCPLCSAFYGEGPSAAAREVAVVAEAGDVTERGASTLDVNEVVL